MQYAQAVDDIGVGQVHEAACFIVTTRWPELNWQPASGPATCGFCIARRAMEGKR